MLLRAHMDPKRSGDDIVTFIRTDLARHNKFLSKVLRFGMEHCVQDIGYTRELYDERSAFFERYGEKGD